MKRFASRRPSPALVISLVALFAALGGTAYALTITGKQVKNRSLTGFDIKGRSLGGKLMAPDSVGYNAVKEQVLDTKKFKQVPSAENADSVGGVAGRRIAATLLESGASKALFTEGPFTLTARCRVDGANRIAEIVVQTNESNSVIEGPTKDLDFDVGDVHPLVSAAGVAATNDPAFDQESAGAAVAPGGTEILGQELYAGTSVLGQPGKCHFGGLVWTG